MKINITILFAVFLCLGVELPAFELSYACFYKTPSDEIKAIDYTEGTATLNQGDLVKLYFQTDACIYLYVILEGAEGGVLRISPRTFTDCRGNTSLKQGLYIPGDAEWFYPFKGTGDEIFYFIASSRRLTALETFLKKYQARMGKDPRGEQTLDARQHVLDEIRRLMFEYLPFLKDIKEEPETVALTFRGGEQYIFTAEKVKAEEFFIKTVTLTH